MDHQKQSGDGQGRWGHSNKILCRSRVAVIQDKKFYKQIQIRYEYRNTERRAYIIKSSNN